MRCEYFTPVENWYADLNASRGNRFVFNLKHFKMLIMKNLHFGVLLVLSLCLFAGNPPVFGQTPIAFGQCLNGSLPTQSSSITYQTPIVKPDDVLLIRVKESGVILKFEIYTPSGTLINTFYGSSTADLIQTIYKIPPGGQTGAYTIIVSNNGFFTGNFSIALERMNEPETTVFLECDNSLNGNLDCGPTIKTYRFLMQQGSRSRIRVAPSGTAPEAWLCDKSGNILRHEALTLGNVITFDTILATDTACLYVFVASSNGFFFNNYSITHTTISGNCAAVSLQPVPNSGIVCEGETFSLSASSPLPGVAFSWSGPNGFTSTQQTITFPEATPAQSGIYTVTATSPTFCSSTASKIITVNPLPDVEAGVNPASGAVCEGTSFTLNVTTNASSPVSYQWSGPDGFTSTQKSPTISNPGTSKSGIYIISVTDGNGCGETDSIEVIVNPLPSAIISSPASGSVCMGATLSLNVTTNAPNATFSWSGPAGFTASIQNPAIPNVTFSNQGTYIVTVTNSATGCSKTASKFINVNSLPTANISGNLSICAGQSTVLTATGGGTYTWSNGQTLAAITVSPTQTTTYTVTVTNTSTGCTDSESKTVTVKPAPSISIISTPAIPEICSGSGTVLLCATSNANNPAYQWTSAGFFSTDQCVNFNVPSESGTYVASVTDGVSGCSNAASLPIIIHPTPAVNILQTPASPYCAGSDFSLCATSNASNPIYNWAGPDNFNGDMLCESFTAASAAQSGTYNVTVTSGNGCTGTATVNVEVGTPLHCEGQFKNGMITVSASGSFPPYSYVLLPGGQTNSTGIFSNLDAGAVYTVTVSDSEGCSCATGLLTGTIDPTKEWGINIAPNPGAGVFEISVKTIPAGRLQFTLFDVNGRLLREFTMEPAVKHLDLTDLPTGMYLLRITEREKVGVLRLMVIK